MLAPVAERDVRPLGQINDVVKGRTTQCTSPWLALLAPAGDRERSPHKGKR
jgi:hypothetical protein